MKTKLLFHVALYSLFVFSPSLSAEEEIKFMGSDELIEKLSIQEEILFRGVGVEPADRIKNKTKAKNKMKETSDSEQVAVVEKPPVIEKKVMLDIKFEYDSSKLSPDAVAQLRELGKALDSVQLQSGNYEIIGHTDSVGSASYNKTLSEKRAGSVVSFLLKNNEIEQSHLNSYGLGEEQLLLKDDPTNGTNRRVEIRRVK